MELMKLETRMRVARNLKALRKSGKLSQEQLAREISICRSTYATYEQGERTPDINTLYAISQFYRVKLDVLINEDIQVALTDFFLNQEYTLDETRLLKLFDGLSTFGKGRVLEHAECLSKSENEKRKNMFKFDF